MELIAELTELMQEKQYTQTQVARAIGRSPSVVSQFLQGTYNGSAEDITERVRGFIERERARTGVRPQARFVMTSIAARGLEVAAYAHQEGEICVIYGAAGMGKTMLLREYARRNLDSLTIEADPGYTAKIMLEDLCRQLKIKGGRASIHDMTLACIRELGGSGRVILVDEAELLPYRALETLRRLHDKSGVGLVLAGLPRLLVNLKGRGNEFAQLYSRVALAYEMGHVMKDADLLDIARHMMPEASDEKIAAALRQFSNGNARRLSKLVRGVYRMKQISGGAITQKTIETFSNMLIS